jgi:formylglycine-generating enzyme required for sulfatase activity
MIIANKIKTSNLIINSANYNGMANWNNTTIGNVTTVGSNGGPSAYGTYDQTGNMWEWTDLDALSGTSRQYRGGYWNSDENDTSSEYYVSSNSSSANIYVGFRIASSNNPLNLSNFVTVDNINNDNDVTGYGSVGYVYKIYKFMITNMEYTEFLNAIAKTDPYGLYHTGMGNVANGAIAGINRSGIDGSYVYSVKLNMENKPVNLINWFDCARYCNWLHNGKPNGIQNSNTTEDGAYTLNQAISGNAILKNQNSLYWIPTENEWYKAAYYTTNKNNTGPGYWKYATQSDYPPTPVTADIIGNGIIPATAVKPIITRIGNSANYNRSANWNQTNFGNIVSVGSSGRKSFYGTYDQSGNVFEWNDLDGLSGLLRGFRGGSWKNIVIFRLSSSFRFTIDPSRKSRFIGFRVSSDINPIGLNNLTEISDINNNNDILGYGMVNHIYKISKYVVTNAEYSEFLNSVAKISDTHNLYDINMTNSIFGGIIRFGDAGNYSYETKSNMENKPVVFVSWFEAARYCNWLHNEKPSGIQNNDTTENGAYSLNSIITNTVASRNIEANYWIPTENEWYKAAYYTTNKNNTGPGYWKYATQSDSDPSPVTANSVGDGIIPIKS